jgi:3-methyladenine DNA glycosylase Tag
MSIFERIVMVYNDKGSKQAVKDLKKLERNFKDAGKKIAKAFGVATLAAGALAVKIGKDGIQAAIRAQAEQNRLEQILLNTNGASKEQVAVLVEQAKALEQLGVVSAGNVSVVQSQLATFDLQASTIQTLTPAILDYITAEKGATASSADFKSMTNGLAQALNGNFTSLTKTGFVLDENTKNTIKNGTEQERSTAILQVLNSTYKDFNENLRDTPEGKIQALRNSFDGLLTTIGFALLPVFEDLVRMFQDELLPAFERFVATNKDQIATTFRNVADFAIKAAKGLGQMFKTIADNMTTFKIFAGILTGIFVGTAVFNGVKALIGIITLLTGAFTKQAVAGTAAGVATAFATGGTSAIAAAVGLNRIHSQQQELHFIAIDKLTDGLDSNTKAVEKQSGVVFEHLKDLKRLGVATAKANLINKKATTTLTNLTKKTKEQIKSDKALAALKKLGVKPTTEKDPIQLEAARLLLLKQANIEEQNKVKALIENAEAQMRVNENAQRYADLLQVLSDQTISSEEVSVLAAKWNVTTGQVLEYIARIYAASTTDINDGAVVNLLMKWGLTKEEAEKYVDFTRALADEKIDDKEIEELMDKWGLSRQGVLDYAKTVQDGTVFSTTWADPGKLAEQSWIDALDALNAYLLALKGVGGGSSSSSSSSNSSNSSSSSKVVKNPFNPVSPVLTRTAVQEQVDTLTSLRKSEEKGTAISFLLKEQIDTLTDSLSTNSMNAFGDERARLRAMGTFNTPTTSSFDPTSFSSANNAGMTVNVNVAGSVTSENDLIETVRTGILSFQQSGKPITAIQRL